MHPIRHSAGGRQPDRDDLRNWRRSPRGRRLIALERLQLRRLLPDVFGRHVLQIGNWGRGAGLIASSATLHHAVLGAVNDQVAAVIDPAALPLQTRSVDAIVLPHTLEFTRSPHTVLREVNRVLNDRGRLFVLGLNPWGLFALRNRLGLRYGAFPPGTRPLSAGRVSDWLELLDFEVTEIRRFGIGFPWLPPLHEGSHWTPASVLSPLAEAYLIGARKRVVPLNFIRMPVRAQVRPLIGVTAPAAGTVRHDRERLHAAPDAAPTQSTLS